VGPCHHCHHVDLVQALQVRNSTHCDLAFAMHCQRLATKIFKAPVVCKCGKPACAYKPSQAPSWQ
jgi:hypothetical protein